MCACDASLLLSGVLLGFALTCIAATLCLQIGAARRSLNQDDSED